MQQLYAMHHKPLKINIAALMLVSYFWIKVKRKNPKQISKNTHLFNFTYAKLL